jgi:hypothetical protein
VRLAAFVLRAAVCSAVVVLSACGSDCTVDRLDDGAGTTCGPTEACTFTATAGPGQVRALPIAIVLAGQCPDQRTGEATVDGDEGVVLQSFANNAAGAVVNLQLRAPAQAADIGADVSLELAEGIEPRSLAFSVLVDVFGG